MEKAINKSDVKSVDSKYPYVSEELSIRIFHLISENLPPEVLWNYLNSDHKSFLESRLKTTGQKYV